MLQNTGRWMIFLAIGLLLAGVASAHYPFVQYVDPADPYAPAPKKFDLNALPDSTVRYYISSDGPVALAPNDSLASIVSQIRSAAEVWNAVPSSALRVAFGGFADTGTPQSTPGIDIIFSEDIPPGVIALGGPVEWSEPVLGESGAYIPIQRSVVLLNKDLSNQWAASEGFYMTLVHEIGHALGLQHTFTSSVMSVELTRATTKGSPLAADDVAGFSWLYPAASFAETTGVISGRVVLGDGGVNLASVVALSPQGAAVSALTNPDGSYRIEGVPPGQYYVYVHPAPPAVFGQTRRGDIILPLDGNGQEVEVGPYFETQFYPGVKSSQSARALTVSAGAVNEGVDFFVQPRDMVDLHAVRTFSFPGNVAVTSGHVSRDSRRRFLVAWGYGLSTGVEPTPGLKASVVGGTARVPADGLLPYAPDPRFVQINVEFDPFSGDGARHLLFSLNNDIHVLPAGLQVTQQEPPWIESVSAAADAEGRPVLAVRGHRITGASRILFDGVPGNIVAVEEGQVLVAPPPTPAFHRATVVAVNRDGQSSWFMNGFDSPTWDFEPHEAPFVRVSPLELPAGSEAMLEFRATNTPFKAGRVDIGFGSSDVVVRDILVVDENLALANVAVSPAAAESTLRLTVVNGLELMGMPPMFHVRPQDNNRLSLHTPAFNPETGEIALHPGFPAALAISNLPADATGEMVSLTLNDQPVPVTGLQPDRIEFLIPDEFAAGPAVVRLEVNGQPADPVFIRIVPAPPQVLTVLDTEGLSITAEHPARPASRLRVVASHLGAPGEEINPKELAVTVGGIRHQVDSVTVSETDPGTWVLEFLLGLTIEPGDAVPLTVSLSGLTSKPLPVAVAPAS